MKFGRSFELKLKLTITSQYLISLLLLTYNRILVRILVRTLLIHKTSKTQIVPDLHP